MMSLIKNYIKTKPYLYDSINALRPIESDLELWIDSYSKSSYKPIRFVQVGASDGLRWDPLRRYVIRDKWIGVLIEPLPPVFKLLEKNYRYLRREELKFENVAISEEEGTIDIWSCTSHFLKDLNVEDKLFHLRKSSLSKSQFERSFGKGEENITCYSVATKSLSDIVNDYFPDGSIDLVFIDAEGCDDSVIKTIDFENVKPRAIVYESHNLGRKNEATERYLEGFGYTVRKVEGDTIATLEF